MGEAGWISDNVGDAAENKKLSQARADAIKDSLV
jgi:outer membrane protein OmpA-like peptidoglycan-associated protein